MRKLEHNLPWVALPFVSEFFDNCGVVGEALHAFLEIVQLGAAEGFRVGFVVVFGFVRRNGEVGRARFGGGATHCRWGWGCGVGGGDLWGRMVDAG